MTEEFRELCEKMVRIADALDNRAPQLASQGQALDGFSALANFRHLASQARTALAAERPESAEPVATLHVSDFRGYENYDFQHLVDLPPGHYKLFTACTAQPPAPAPAADGEREELAQWLDHKGRGAWPCPDGFSAKAEAEEYEMFSGLTRAAALLREARPQPMPGWQPIDTAPQDGSEILASDYDALEIVSWSWCAWENGSGWIDRNGQRLFPAWWQPLPDHPPIPQPPQGGEVEQ